MTAALAILGSLLLQAPLDLPRPAVKAGSASAYGLGCRLTERLVALPACAAC